MSTRSSQSLQRNLKCDLYGKIKSTSEDDDDIIVESEDPRKLVTCPVTTAIFEEPMRNKLCGHCVDKKGVAQMIAARKKMSCPVPGCSKGKNIPCRWEEYEEDEEMRLKVESWERREKRRREKEAEEEEDSSDGEEGMEDVEVL